MNANGAFQSILELSDQEEKKRIDRSLDELMEDEYRLNSHTKKLIEDHNYVFPSLHQDQNTTADRLIRTQAAISAKKHYYGTVPYFHHHDFIEMVYVYKGLCYQYIESRDQLMVLKEGDLFILNQNVLHALHQPYAEDVMIKIIIPTQYLSLEFAQHQKFHYSIVDFLQKSVSAGNTSYHYLHFHTGRSPLIKFFIEQLVTEYYRKDLYFEDAMCCYLRLLFIELGRTPFVNDAVHFEMKARRLEYGELLNYVRANVKTITLGDLAEHFSYNKCYLSRLISEEFGKGFQHIVREVRMEEIERRIRYSNLPIEKIAEQVGYKNAVVIYKMIRDKYNMTPAEYRKNQLQ